MDESLPGCNAIVDVLLGTWSKDALFHKWTLPDGHVAKVRVLEPTELRINIEELDDTRFTFRYNKNTPSTNGVSILANVVQSIDGYIVREMIRKCHFEVAVIFDCFMCHPNNAEKMKQKYREIMSEIASSDLLNDICSEIMGRDAGIEVSDEGLANMILNSEYALS